MGVPVHFFHMRVRAHFSKSLVQNHEHKTRNSICREISWKLYAGKFLGNQMMKISWKLYAGKFLETMCWKIWVDAGGFLMGVIMAQCYGIILRFQGNGRRGSVEHPSSADLSRMKQSEASEVIGSVELRLGMRNPAGSNRCSSLWASAAVSK